MATLVLTAVGSAIGGPIGGAIGAALGQRIDQSIFAPKPREGPRLKELDVQTSSYGTPVPAIFGAMRVAGTVIWATDLIERRAKSGGGKGRPSTVNYSYSVSMAVALSSRPVLRVGRIWADGNLLRGADGDLKVDTQFRLHQGHEDQPPDSLIASAEAAGGCPAHRGLAYAVFEDLQLADYGNRIPSLTFEIFDREGEVRVTDIFAQASARTIGGDSVEAITGYAMTGADARAGLAPLLDALPIYLRAKDGGLEIGDDWSGDRNVVDFTPVTSDGPRSFDDPRRTLEPASMTAASLTMKYYDQARDFQSSIQRADRGSVGRLLAQIEFPAVIGASSAKRLAELALMKAHQARHVFVCQTAAGSDPAGLGDWIADASGQKWRIMEIEHYAGSSTITACGAVATAPVAGPSASSGRNLPSPDFPAGQTKMVVIDLPVFDTVDPGQAQVAVFACGTSPGWRRAALSLRQGDASVEIGSTAAPAVAGEAVSALPGHTTNLVDETNYVDVELFHDNMEIPAGPGSPLANDALWCWLEGEFIRFGYAEALGHQRFRLSRLQRGCFDTAEAIGGHLVGDRLVLLDAEAARLLDNNYIVAGQPVVVEAIGLGDAEPVQSAAVVDAKAITPLSPVHGSAAIGHDGELKLNWIRRARIDFSWRDGADQVLSEDAEQYRVLLDVDGQTIGNWITTVPELLLSPAALTALPITSQSLLHFAVQQIGRHGISGPLAIVSAALA